MWLYLQLTTVSREPFTTSLGNSGNFSKEFNSEEVLFKFKKKMFSMENPTGLFPANHAKRNNFNTRSLLKIQLKHYSVPVSQFSCLG